MYKIRRDDFYGQNYSFMDDTVLKLSMNNVRIYLFTSGLNLSETNIVQGPYLILVNYSLHSEENKVI